MNERRIQDRHALVPMQAGMLFNTLRAPRSGVDILQAHVTLDEDLDVERFRAAWQRVVAEHTTLRSAFRWDTDEPPSQVVHADVELPWRVLDWSADDPAAQEAAWAALARDDRAAGFDMAVAPLMRVTLVRLGTARWRALWPIHHALVDTLAMVTLLRQVFACYDAADAAPPVLEVGVPQRAYAEWYAGLDPAQAEPFWRERLEGVDEAVRLGLPAPDAPPGAAGGPTGREAAGPGLQDVVTRVLDADASAALVAWGKQHGVSVNTLLQAAWALLLSRYGGRRRVVLGAVKSCRRSCMQGGASMIGLALNTLPFVVDVDPDARLLDWLAALRQDWVALRAFEHTPLVDMKAWAGLAGSTPLFESVLCFDPVDYSTALASQGGDWSRRRLDIFGQPDAPLTINAFGGERLTLRATFDPRRLSRATVERVLVHLETLLGRFRSADDLTLADLDVLPDDERHTLFEVWNTPVPADPQPLLLHELFTAQAAATPRAPAVAWEDGALDYGELAARAHQLAHRLIERGLGPGDGVALCLERSPQAMVAVLAVLAAGAAYVPVDPTWPVARGAVVLEDGAVGLLLHHGATADLAHELAAACPGVERLCLDAAADDLARAPREAPPRRAAPSDTAYVLFTSGSTGRPKGVAMPHGPLVNLISWQRRHSSAGPGSRTLHFAPLGFDVSCQELFATWAAGGCLQLLDDRRRRDPAALLDALERHAVTRVFLPFVALQALVDAALQQERLPTALREVITAGEQLVVGPGLRAFCRRTGCSLVNQYGPTECHVVTAHELVGDPDGWPLLPPIGRPIDGARTYVLDGAGRPVPIGVTGELHLAGAAVGSGYPADPEATARAFVHDPFDDRPGARMYRSGDLARWLDDGTLQFLGRADDQVKLRGYRVELGELESVLASHPGVREAAAALRGEGPAGQRLVAYVVVDGEAPPADLSEHLRRRLPEFMLPAVVVALPALPLTASGKLDRRALPDPGRRAGVATTLPRTETESRVAQIWCELLELESVGVDEDFFGLGGHSLLAMQVISRLRAACGVEVPLQRLFDLPTVCGLAEHIETLRWAGSVAGDGGSADDEVFEV